MYNEIYFNNVPDMIIDGLYLGSYYEARQKEDLLNLKITHILITAQSLVKNYPNVYYHQIEF